MKPPRRGPILLAYRHESDDVPTVLTYGHGAVLAGHDHQWRDDLSPWSLTVEGEGWYGRGAVDNKGQHSINLAALEHVIQARQGRLGFKLTAILETGEERGSVGVRAVIADLGIGQYILGQALSEHGSESGLSYMANVCLAGIAWKSWHWTRVIRKNQ